MFRASAYAGRGERTERNESDAIIEQALVMTASREAGGYVAAMSVDVQRA